MKALRFPLIVDGIDVAFADVMFLADSVGQYVIDRKSVV